jgi:hypothetical protein
MLPNFFIVGTGKAGTTSLYDYLGQHPEIYMSPVKEPSYFASEIRAAHLSKPFEQHVRRQSRQLAARLNDGRPVKDLGWLAGNWDDYLRLFQNVRGEKAIGEASPAYLWSRTAAANIHATIPAAKIIMILRDPAERAHSHYLHQVATGLTRQSFRSHLSSCERTDRSQLSVWHPFLEVGLYSQQVKRYLDVFPSPNIRIYLFEEAWVRPRQFLEGLFTFLGVDAAFRPDVSRKLLERRTPRLRNVHYVLKRSANWVVPERLRERISKLLYRSGGPAMNPQDRRYLVDYYREDVRLLSSLLNRDLSAWLK